MTEPTFTPAPAKRIQTCEHCGRLCGDHEGGFASLNGFPVCHPNTTDRPDCYTLVTLHHHDMPCLECGQLPLPIWTTNDGALD